jgi:hypothetical protein
MKTLRFGHTIHLRWVEADISSHGSIEHHRESLEDGEGRLVGGRGESRSACNGGKNDDSRKLHCERMWCWVGRQLL